MGTKVNDAFSQISGRQQKKDKIKVTIADVTQHNLDLVSKSKRGPAKVSAS